MFGIAEERLSWTEDDLGRPAYVRQGGFDHSASLFVLRLYRDEGKTLTRFSWMILQSLIHDYPNRLEAKVVLCLASTSTTMCVSWATPASRRTSLTPAKSFWGAGTRGTSTSSLLLGGSPTTRPRPTKSTASKTRRRSSHSFRHSERKYNPNPFDILVCLSSMECERGFGSKIVFSMRHLLKYLN